jgi:hypothetical protein
MVSGIVTVITRMGEIYGLYCGGGCFLEHGSSIGRRTRLTLGEGHVAESNRETHGGSHEVWSQG